MTHLTADDTPNRGEPGASQASHSLLSLLTALREQLLARCDTEEELKTLCAELGVNYDDLPAQGREAKARELVAWLDRHNRIQGGLNQLWRNQLLGLSIEQDERQPYRRVIFSVVKHPRNKHLDKSLAKYQNLIANNPKFSVFTSADVIASATRSATPISATGRTALTIVTSKSLSCAPKIRSPAEHSMSVTLEARREKTRLLKQGMLQELLTGRIRLDHD